MTTVRPDSRLQHRQNLVELHKRLRTMHAADVAFVLEALPPEDRLTVWEEVALWR